MLAAGTIISLVLGAVAVIGPTRDVAALISCASQSKGAGSDSLGSIVAKTAILDTSALLSCCRSSGMLLFMIYC